MGVNLFITSENYTMIFKHLANLAQKGITITIQVAQADQGKLEVSVIPTSESGKTGVALVSKAFIATPDELDAEFPEVIAGYAAATCSLQDQMAAFNAQIASAEKAAQEAVKVAQAEKGSKTASRPSSTPVAKKPSIDAQMIGEDDSDGDSDGSDGTVAADLGSAATESDPVPFML